MKNVLVIALFVSLASPAFSQSSWWQQPVLRDGINRGANWAANAMYRKASQRREAAPPAPVPGSGTLFSGYQICVDMRYGNRNPYYTATVETELENFGAGPFPEPLDSRTGSGAECSATYANLAVVVEYPQTTGYGGRYGNNQANVNLPYVGNIAVGGGENSTVRTVEVLITFYLYDGNRRLNVGRAQAPGNARSGQAWFAGNIGGGRAAGSVSGGGYYYNDDFMAAVDSIVKGIRQIASHRRFRSIVAQRN